MSRVNNLEWLIEQSKTLHSMLQCGLSMQIMLWTTASLWLKIKFTKDQKSDRITYCKKLFFSLNHHTGIA